MELHQNQFANYENIVLPDVPTTDKAEHNFLLRKHGFTDLPHLLVRQLIIFIFICLFFISHHSSYNYVDGFHRWISH